METSERKKLGKQTRAAGQRFELKVRHDLEKNGWIVCKWSNNVELEDEKIDNAVIRNGIGKLIPAKHKFNFFRKAMTMGSGFPDFIAIKRADVYSNGIVAERFIVQLVESKMAGKLDREEKDKCDWIIENLKIPIIIASKGAKRGEIIYAEYSSI